MTGTPLDAAHAAHAAAPEGEAAHLRFLECVLDAELHLLLDTEPEADRLDPSIFQLETGPCALAFDRVDRLAAFLDAPAPYAAFSGRRLADLLAGQGIGLGLNLGPYPSAALLPPEAIDWLAAMAAEHPAEAAARPTSFGPPPAIGPDALAALSRKIGAMADVIRAAHLVRAEYTGAPPGLVLALVDVPAPAHAGVAAAIAEALRFAADAPDCDVLFVAPDAPVLAAITRASLVFELPKRTPRAAPAAPGSDPSRPPILR